MKKWVSCSFIKILPPYFRRASIPFAGRIKSGLTCIISLHRFGHNFQTVTPFFARFEALESLFNALSNNEWISTKLMIYFYLILRFIRRFVGSVAQNCAFWSRVFDTLLLVLQKRLNTYKMNRKLSNGTQMNKNSIKSYLYIFIQKAGNYSKNTIQKNR